MTEQPNPLRVCRLCGASFALTKRQHAAEIEERGPVPLCPDCSESIETRERIRKRYGG